MLYITGTGTGTGINHMDLSIFILISAANGLFLLKVWFGVEGFHEFVVFVVFEVVEGRVFICAELRCFIDLGSIYLNQMLSVCAGNFLCGFKVIDL